MKSNDFVWTDLSAFDLLEAQEFYKSVFHWEYTKVDENYYVAHNGVRDCSGLYLMPEKFVKMNLPSFWMSYIQVQDVMETVAIAKELGAIIELVDTSSSFERIALIRDPLGAGFTIYEGESFNARTENIPGTLVWNELFVSDFKMVKEFYSGIFNWQFEKEKYDRYSIISEGNKIAAIQQMSNEIKGEHEYWAVFFATKDLSVTRNKILKTGGKILYEGDGIYLYADPHGAMFQLQPVQTTPQ